MITNLQLYIAIGLPVIAVLASMIVSLLQISGVRDSIRHLREHMDKRIDDLKALIDARFDMAHSELIRVEQVMDACLKHLEKVDLR
jgi:hypothetical protein